MEMKKPDVAKKPKRKHRRPRKIKVDAPIDTVKEQFATETHWNCRDNDKIYTQTIRAEEEPIQVTMKFKGGASSR
jgi:hypothetical protein